MTAQEMRRLFAYNAWATNRVFDAVRPLAEQLNGKGYVREAVADCGSIESALQLLVSNERMWLVRLTGKREVATASSAELSTLDGLRSFWQETAARLARFVARLDEKTLAGQVNYTTTEGNESREVRQILQHIVNQSTYHRGQIELMMRAVGGEPANTELIAFFRHVAID